MGEVTRSDWHDWGSHRIPKNAWYFINPPTFGTFFIQVDAPFETIRFCGFEWWNNCVQCWFPKWFWMVGQLIQNLVWIFPNGSTANTKPCLDTSMWWINGPSKTVWMDLNGSTACVYKTNGHFWKWKFGMVSKRLSVGGLMITLCFFPPIHRSWQIHDHGDEWASNPSAWRTERRCSQRTPTDQRVAYPPKHARRPRCLGWRN